MDAHLQCKPVNEVRIGGLWVDGGQRSPNAGTNLSGRQAWWESLPILLDMGYPQFSFAASSRRWATRRCSLFAATMTSSSPTTSPCTGVAHTEVRTYAMGYGFGVNPNGARGSFSFTPAGPLPPGLADGNAFADFLLGYPPRSKLDSGAQKWTPV